MNIILIVVVLFSFAISLYAKDLNLTIKEKEYLKNKEVINLCIRENFMPFEDINKKNKHIGMTSGYYKIFKKDLNITFNIIKAKSTNQALNYMNNKRCDIISNLEYGLEFNNVQLTKPYVVSPLVVAIGSRVSFISDFYNLGGKRMGVDKNFLYAKILKKLYPNIIDTDVKNVENGLYQVDNKELFGQIGTLAEVAYLFEKNFMGELKIAGKTDDVDLALSMGIDKENKLLYSIMTKAIDNLDSSIHYDILNEWAAIKYDKSLPKSIIFSVILVLVIAILLSIIFIKKNRKLQIAQNEIQKLNNTLEQRVKIEVDKNRIKDSLMLQQSKMAQMGEMISIIAHQWKQPLSSINSLVIAIQLDKITNKYNFDNKNEVDCFFESLNTRFHKINQQIKHLSNTMDDFRNFFKPNKEKEKVQIIFPIGKTLEIISTELENNNIKMITNFEVNDDIYIHNNEIIHVLLNILKNAQDNFLEKNISNPRIIIGTKYQDNKLLLYVQDNGGGIKQDILPKIFDPYFTTKKRQEGTGIGLYMSKLIIEEYHGGKILAHNIENGVVFSITFN